MTTDLLERAMEVAKGFSPEMQNDVARIVLHLAGEEGEPFKLEPHEEASIVSSREQALRGEFVSDEKVRAIWAKHAM